MSTPAPAESPLLHATKKQLDELDSLIQRMLALPVVEVPEDVSGPLERRQPQGEPEPVLEMGLEEPLPDSPEEAPLASEELEALLPPSVASDEPPAAAPEPLGVEVPKDIEPEEEAPPPRIGLAWPLVPPNWLFDVATTPLGPAGGWLRGEHGRMLLGFTGLALLLAAAVVGVLDWVLGNW